MKTCRVTWYGACLNRSTPKCVKTVPPSKLRLQKNKSSERFDGWKKWGRKMADDYEDLAESVNDLSLRSNDGWGQFKFGLTKFRSILPVQRNQPLLNYTTWVMNIMHACALFPHVITGLLSRRTFVQTFLFFRKEFVVKTSLSAVKLFSQYRRWQNQWPAKWMHFCPPKYNTCTLKSSRDKNIVHFHSHVTEI